MTLISRLRSATWFLPVAALSLAAVACGASPEGGGSPEAKASTGVATESLPTGSTGPNTGCSSTYSCAGIIGAPPEIIVTCPAGETVLFENNGTPIEYANSYQESTSDYAGSLDACRVYGDLQYCDSFSTDVPVTQWCPGSGGSSSGGSSSGGGKGGCHGICM